MLLYNNNSVSYFADYTFLRCLNHCLVVSKNLPISIHSLQTSSRLMLVGKSLCVLFVPLQNFSMNFHRCSNWKAIDCNGTESCVSHMGEAGDRSATAQSKGEYCQKRKFLNCCMQVPGEPEKKFPLLKIHSTKITSQI